MGMGSHFVCDVGGAIERFDEAWYTGAYTDVAGSGIRPRDHYLKYGWREGRLPYMLQAAALENVLWGGFSVAGEQSLLEKVNCVEIGESLYARWALARWYAFRSRWSDAVLLLNFSLDEVPYFLLHSGLVSLHAEAHAHSGMDISPYSLPIWLNCDLAGIADYELLTANILPTSGMSDDAVPLFSPIDALNFVWSRACLLSVSMQNGKDRGGLDGLYSPQPTSSVDSEHSALVSVVLPVYQSAATLAQAIGCLTAQTWTDLEIIVVDDGSTDGAASVVLELQRFDPRIRYLRRTCNGGAYAARNDGLMAAKGDFILVHDSDDWSHPQRIEKMVEPLLNNRRLVGSLVCMVRCTSNLYFRDWRHERNLVRAGVSTLLVRRDALLALGGWDNVRVGADSELYNRLVKVHGKDAFVTVLPDVPLLLARQSPGSLTTQNDTHLRTQFWGLRRHYSEISSVWADMAAVPDGLKLTLGGRGLRPFAVPSRLLHSAEAAANGEVGEHIVFDCVLMADFGATAANSLTLRTLVAHWLSGGMRLAVFHWPKWRNLEPLDAYYWQRAVEGQLVVLDPSEKVHATELVVLGSELMSDPPDTLPCVTFDRRQVLDDTSVLLAMPLPRRQACSDAAATLLSSSEWFDEAWYLARYPDVASAGMSAARHYLHHGAIEGREPSFQFNSAHYLQQCPVASDSGWPALLHFLKAGERLGHNPGNPVLSGRFAHIEGARTVLVCAHAANEALLGAERSLLDVLDGFATLRVNVVVVTPSVRNSTYVAQLRDRAVAVACVPMMHWRAELTVDPHALAALVELIDQYAIDAVWANTLLLREPLAAAHKKGIAAAVHVRELPTMDAELCAAIGLPAKEIQRQVCLSCDLVLVNSLFSGRFFADQAPISLVGNVIDMAAFDVPAPALDDGVLRVALISSNQPKKGIGDALAIADALALVSNKVQVLLIGPDNEHTEQIKVGQASSKVPANVCVAGYASSPQVALAQAHVVMNLSHVAESFGRTILEAMAAGRPVVAYRRGALAELIEDGVTGFLVQPGDTDAVSNRISLLVRDGQLREQMGQRGRQRAALFNAGRLALQLGLALDTLWRHASKAAGAAN